MGSELDNIIQISITRETTAVSEANFGTIGIVGEFATGKTNPAFNRYREYSSLTEMAGEGWSVSDAVYKAAQKIFSQNPVVPSIVVMRKDAADDDWTDTLDTIQASFSDWYGFVITPTINGKVVYSGDFVSLNSIAFSLNGTPITPVVYTTSHANTMTLLKAAIEAAVATANVTIDPADVNGRTLLIDVYGADVTAITSTVTLGTGQATATITYPSDDDTKEVADWTETQTKLFGIESSDANILDSQATSDIAYYINDLGYVRSFVIYSATTQYSNAALLGQGFPYDPGYQTYAFKTLTGVSAATLSTSQKNAALAKKCNTYTSVGGVSITEFGTVGSGEYIDVIRDVDWIQARIQERIYSALVNSSKIPYTDSGVQVVTGIIRGVLTDGVAAGILRDGTLSVTAPLVSAISANDRANRLLPDVTFSAELAGAIHKVEIAGTVSV